MIRKTVRRERAMLSETHYQQYSQAICNTVLSLPIFQSATHIAVYYPLGHEVSPLLLCNASNKQFYLPHIGDGHDNTMSYYPYQQGDTLIKNRYGILEPNITTLTAVSPDTLDLLIVPLVAFDQNCNRLGQGSGFYDRYLGQYQQHPNRPMFIGLAYEFQRVDTVPTNAQDIRLDCIVTEKTRYTLCAHSDTATPN